MTRKLIALDPDSIKYAEKIKKKKLTAEEKYYAFIKDIFNPNKHYASPKDFPPNTNDVLRRGPSAFK